MLATELNIAQTVASCDMLSNGKLIGRDSKKESEPQNIKYQQVQSA